MIVVSLGIHGTNVYEALYRQSCATSSNLLFSEHDKWKEVTWKDCRDHVIVRGHI